VARCLYQSGEFARAREVVQPLLAEPRPARQAIGLVAELAHLHGRYPEAERLYRRLADSASADPAARVDALRRALDALYLEGRFTAARDLELPAGVVLPRVDLMRAFDADPYRPAWRGSERTATLPFLATDPLPLVEVEFNGVPVNLLFDTGADLFILDDEVARGLGVRPLASAPGRFGGGLGATVGLGRVDSVRLGAVTLHGLPVNILPTKRFSAIYPNGWTVGGFIGTAALRQFVATVDYARGRLVLRPRTPESARAVRDSLAGRLAGEVPFVLASSHFLMAPGRLNQERGLTFFVDSGLASEAAVSVPVQTLDLLGIPEPKREVPAGSVGGGGGVWASGLVDLDTLGLGGLVQGPVKAEFGARPPQSYWERGFIVDGLISHQFLRRYRSWTLDFDAMTFLFER
jgi:hypothetical protein